MSEEFVDPFKGVPAKKGPKRKLGPNDAVIDTGPLVSPEDAAPPLSDEEHQELEELLASPIVEAAAKIADLPEGADLALLRPDEIPVVGRHYVIFQGKPMPVLLGQYGVSEEDHVLGSASAVVGLKDPDGKRFERAKDYASWRYKGYLCGEVDGL